MASREAASAPAETYRLLSVLEAAKRLGVSRSKLYELIGSRRINFVKIDDCPVRFRPEDLDAFAADHLRLRVVK